MYAASGGGSDCRYNGCHPSSVHDVVGIVPCHVLLTCFELYAASWSHSDCSCNGFYPSFVYHVVEHLFALPHVCDMLELSPQYSHSGHQF